MNYNSKCSKNKNKCKKNFCTVEHVLGFVLLVFGAVTICAFLLPIKVWVFLLGSVLIVCGCKVIRI